MNFNTMNKLSAFIAIGLCSFKIMDDYCELIASTGIEIYWK